MISIAASCTGPHVVFSPVARLCACTAFDLATDSFHTQRHRSHSASSAVRADVDRRRRKVHRACPETSLVFASAVMNSNLPGRNDS